MLGSYLNDWLTLPLADLSSIGMPERKSTIAEMVDSHYAFINWVNVIFFVPMMAVLLYIVYRFTKPAGEKAESDVSHNTPLEITWSVIPLILVCIMFWIGFKGYNEMIAAPADAYTVNVRAQRWSWSFRYPDVGLEIDELHVPPGVPVRLSMTSADVLHAFFVPEFRVKQDVVPGKISSVWFEPIRGETDELEEYTILCAEYCGTQHSAMHAKLVVHPTWESFLAWQQEMITIDPNAPWDENGAMLYKRKGCIQCHAVEPNAPGTWVGPSWVGLWGKTADEHKVHIGGKNGPIEGVNVFGEEGQNYLVESMVDPQAKIVAGYGENMVLMNFKDEEILYLIAYIKSLGEEPPTEEE